MRDDDKKRAAAIADKAQAVVDAYCSRFESRGQPNGLFGPIDGEIVALRRELKKVEGK